VSFFTVYFLKNRKVLKVQKSNLVKNFHEVVANLFKMASIVYTNSISHQNSKFNPNLKGLLAIMKDFKEPKDFRN
jgi:hypothetical protein